MILRYRDLHLWSLGRGHRHLSGKRQQAGLPAFGAKHKLGPTHCDNRCDRAHLKFRFAAELLASELAPKFAKLPGDFELRLTRGHRNRGFPGTDAIERKVRPRSKLYRLLPIPDPHRGFRVRADLHTILQSEGNGSPHFAQNSDFGPARDLGEAALDLQHSFLRMSQGRSQQHQAYR